MSWEVEGFIRSPYQHDTTAVVFSVDNQIKFPCLKPGFAVFHHQGFGPAFG